MSSSLNFPCYHLKGEGGIHAAIKTLHEKTPDYPFVLRSDVAQFYESMQPGIVIKHCKPIIKDKRILNIITQLFHRVEIYQGEYWLKTPSPYEKVGLPRGCSLSPLIGAIMLKSLENCIPQGSFYIRYMDDFVILSKSRAKLRWSIKAMHKEMKALHFTLALDKTTIGRTSNGFDFLGMQYAKKGLCGMAAKTINHFNQRVLTLYEQRASWERIAAYVKRALANFSSRLKIMTKNINNLDIFFKLIAKIQADSKICTIVCISKLIMECILCLLKQKYINQRRPP